MGNPASQSLRHPAGPEAYELPPTKRNRGMISMSLTLAAGVPQRIGVSGDYFHVMTASVDDLQVRFDDGKATPVYEGVGFRAYYDGLELSSSTGQAVVVLVGFGSVFDGRATANVNVTANVAPGNTLTSSADVSCTHGAATQLLAARADRLYALIGNPSTNTITMRVGESAATATRGIILEPGTVLPVASTAAIYAYNGHASTDESVSVLEVREV